jgi:hypothetical protein
VVIADASPLTFDDPFVLICAAIVAVFAVARWTRLIVDDDYPPTRWLTERFVRAVPEKWGVLVECSWCTSPYVAAIIVGWAWATDLHWSWWFVNVIASLSWLAGFMGARDIPIDQRGE